MEKYLDVIFAAFFVLAALSFLGFRLRKRIKSMRDPHAGCECNCGCGGKRKFPDPSKR